ncbi:hypothetical protein HOP50_06g41850 [Chloropicon primus]|uniref:Uncharacterized protein n=1 Tax=Chloropicon primus TaxID=1764295 RepID=A0A5B8MLX4_9CHLO|nr:hypothetical protein A3770_06p41760 [Chloropicon primus]UPR00869.1 hypothetical protein HOP50_06g41850 [Chloropicon primus]|mmetsp:Transcript_1529/g.4411  ORF Transcript_1529/g.4411 Transcript_1529/m.4411 type:complete len:226 (-) Transcript_1529:297-974(-)|eukprot:QDZ21658.1 hypothetical protein A3770_06p41760 [Chloropicon primus]
MPTKSDGSFVFKQPDPRHQHQNQHQHQHASSCSHRDEEEDDDGDGIFNPGPPRSSNASRKKKGKRRRDASTSTAGGKKKHPEVSCSIQYRSFTCRSARVVIKRKSCKGDTVFFKHNWGSRNTKNMNYSTDKEHAGHATRARLVRKVAAVFVLVATLTLWMAVAGYASRQSEAGASAAAGRRLLFIPRYYWPTAPPGPAGCLFRGACTTWGTRYPPDIFTALTGSY